MKSDDRSGSWKFKNNPIPHRMDSHERPRSALIVILSRGVKDLVQSAARCHAYGTALTPRRELPVRRDFGPPLPANVTKFGSIISAYCVRCATSIFSSHINTDLRRRTRSTVRQSAGAPRSVCQALELIVLGLSSCGTVHRWTYGALCCSFMFAVCSYASGNSVTP